MALRCWTFLPLTESNANGLSVCNARCLFSVLCRTLDWASIVQSAEVHRRIVWSNFWSTRAFHVVICARASLPIVTKRVIAEPSTNRRRPWGIFELYSKIEDAGARSDCVGHRGEHICWFFGYEWKNFRCCLVNETNMDNLFLHSGKAGNIMRDYSAVSFHYK